MSIPRPNPGRKQGSSTARMSKTTSNSPSNLEKRDQDQHESQDTKHRFQLSTRKILQKKSFTSTFKIPLGKLLWPPPLIIFSPATQNQPGLPHGANPSKARIHVPLRHCSPLLLDTINTIP